MSTVKEICLFAALFSVLNFASSQLQKTDNSSRSLYKPRCPTWMHRATNNISSNSSNKSNCTCGRDHNSDILCNSTLNTLHIVDGLAMTYNEKTQQVIAGHTVFGWTDKQISGKRRDRVYRQVPLNRLEINKKICGRFRRTGQLCGDCKANHTPQIYSYSLSCKKCSISDNNWLLFVLSTFAPLTLFYIFALIFNFNANHPDIHAYILATQLLYSPPIVRFYFSQYNLVRWSKILMIIYGLWNLDFLSITNTKFCLHLSTLNALAVHYIMPCYALFLIIVTWIAIQLHSHGCKVVIKMYGLLQMCINCTKLKKWQHKSSIVDVFATFLLLSYNRMLSTHFDMLVYTEPFNQYGEKIGKYLYYAPTFPYFKGQHLPYGILALVACLFCTLFPILLLLLYPLKLVQKCLNVLKMNRYGLHIFYDSFTGCYKDGTEPGTRDCRYFAALFLILRILMYLTLSLVSPIIALAINGAIIMLFLAIFIACQPYKNKFAIYNKITGIMLAAMSAAYMIYLGTLLSRIKAMKYANFNKHFLTVLVFMPQLYITGLVVRRLQEVIRNCRKDSENEPLLNHNSSSPLNNYSEKM